MRELIDLTDAMRALSRLQSSIVNRRIRRFDHPEDISAASAVLRMAVDALHALPRFGVDGRSTDPRHRHGPRHRQG